MGEQGGESMRVIKHDGALPIKIWGGDIEDGAMEQAVNLSALPFAFRHIAIMPDVHQGYGMPIGGVMATRGAVVPNAVGVDIGCGMCAARSELKKYDIVGSGDLELVKKCMGEIRKATPVGFDHHPEPQDEALMPLSPGGVIVEQQYQSALHQIGTLGGGNHFIEIQYDEEERIWLMIHSGSRNIGYKVANHYNKVAQGLNERWFSSVPKEHELAFLPIETDEAKEYLCEMNYCVDFALANRKLMMARAMEAVNLVMGNPTWHPIINIAHNYAVYENHFRQNVIVHRKGATRARLDEVGIIPGSQGTSSYIVRGLGNPESFNSCSHGAGRRMGRKQATRELDLGQEQERLDGIVHSVRNVRDLDDAPGAYKYIDSVMGHQADLVEITHKLTPLGVVKG